MLVTGPLLGTQPTAQACALTGNQTRDPLVNRPMLSPLSHTSQGCWNAFWNEVMIKDKHLGQFASCYTVYSLNKTLEDINSFSTTHPYACFCFSKANTLALAGVVQLVGVSSCTSKGRRFNSYQGTCLGCGFGPWLGQLGEATRWWMLLSHQCFSHSFPLFLKSISMYSGEDFF